MYLTYPDNLDRLPQAFARGVEADPTHAVTDFLEQHGGTSCQVLGYGGSFSLAHFFERLLREHFDIAAKATSPYDYLISKGVRGEGVVLISKGGNQQDILQPLAKAVADQARFILILTAYKKTDLLDRALRHAAEHGAIQTLVIPSIQEHKEGFLGVQWVVAALGAMLDMVPDIRPHIEVDPEDTCRTFCHEAERLLADNAIAVDELVSSQHLIGLATGWGTPALVDFESKLVEARLGPVEICETKAYTHGRYIGTFASRRLKGLRPRLIGFATADEGEDHVMAWLDGHMTEADLPILPVTSPRHGALGGAQLVVSMMHLVGKLGTARGIDPSRPATGARLTRVEQKLKAILRRAPRLYTGLLRLLRC